MANHESEFSLRVEFFRGRDGDGVQGGREYAGSMILETVRAAAQPRTGEYIHMLNPWMPFPYTPVAGVEHRLGGIKPYRPGEPANPSAAVIIVVEVPWPGDDVKDQFLEDFNAQGWTWIPTAAEQMPELAREE
jgi:hypothetical protein